MQRAFFYVLVMFCDFVCVNLYNFFLLLKINLFCYIIYIIVLRRK